MYRHNMLLPSALVRFHGFSVGYTNMLSLQNFTISRELRTSLASLLHVSSGGSINYAN